MKHTVRDDKIRKINTAFYLLTQNVIVLTTTNHDKSPNTGKKHINTQKERE